MISIVSVIFIMLTHFIADFLCQTREMATKKSKSLYWLTLHVLVYSGVTTIGWILLFGTEITTVFSVLGLTFITHWATDFCTSKLTTYFYTKERYFEFFGVIGMDQLIHTSTLLLTYGYLFN
jgi:hypothetical protein